jgi:hypothetical protein
MWKLRLFVSADLVGSTAYKATRSDEWVPAWAPTFKEFFREFPTFVESRYSNLPEKSFKYCENRLTAWKFLGDEVLFQTQIHDHTEVPTHLWAFKQAVADFPGQWGTKNIPLRLKGSAWLAGFPVTNSEIKIETDAGATIDFIGPSIDLGFRLARFSDERRFVLSADLAVMLLDAIHRLYIPNKYFVLFLHGKENLKGIINNKPYPVVWLDNGDEDKDIEEFLLGVKRESDPAKMSEYLRKFIERNSPNLFRPFIETDKDPRYNQIPVNFVALREKMKIDENDRGYLTDPSEHDDLAAGPAKAPKPPVTPRKKKTQKPPP